MCKRMCKSHAFRATKPLNREIPRDFDCSRGTDTVPPSKYPLLVKLSHCPRRDFSPPIVARLHRDPMSASCLRNSGCGLTPAHRAQPLGRGDTNPLATADRPRKGAAQRWAALAPTTIGGDELGAQAGEARRTQRSPRMRETKKKRGLQLETPPLPYCPGAMSAGT